VGDDSFIALDFETANEELSSPCAVGWAIVVGGAVVGVGHSLICPPSFRFRDFNVGIHGVHPAQCEVAPPWPEVLSKLGRIVGTRTVVAHNARFDSGVVRESCDATSLAWPDWNFVCTMRLGRSVWPGLPSYTLVDVAYAAGLSTFDHHQADADATAAAGIVVAAIALEKAGGLAALLGEVGIEPEPIHPGGHSIGGRWMPNAHVPKVATPGLEVHSDHPFFGKKVAFTGDLHSMTRLDAQQAVLDVGGRGMTSVSKLTNFVVVGGEFFGLREGHLSGKLEKAKALQDQGYPLELLNEHDFLSLLHGH
jgi:DNA polymerase III epsilon subunit-like protein